MFTLITALFAILLIVAAGVDLFLAPFSADDLSNMGIEKQ